VDCGHFDVAQYKFRITEFIPRSRKNPQFTTDSLAAFLKGKGIRYAWFKDLGGLRHARKDSINTYWRNASFRGFADYMQTPQFAAALGVLIKKATGCRTAIMCAEALQWRCHRSMIADALCARGIRVFHIQSSSRLMEHRLNDAAVVRKRSVSYPGPDTEESL
jgi:uncharacterized protein (DUF488 family)